MCKLVMVGLVMGYLLFTSSVSWGTEVTDVRIEADGMLSVNGERVFVLGLYEHPEEDAVLQAVADAGFNLVQARQNQQELDRLHELGLWAWVNTGMHVDLSVNTSARKESIQAMVESIGQHPTLLIWEVPDEALWNNWYPATLWRLNEEPEQLRTLAASQEPPVDIDAQLEQIMYLYSYARYREGEDLANAIWEQLGATSPRAEFRMSDAEAKALIMARGLKEGYDFLRTLDPMLPVWMNHAPRNTLELLSLFNEAADIAGCDIYPVPRTYRVMHSDMAEQSMAAVGVYTRRMQETAPGKPVWMVLQGFGWGDILPELEEEIREELRRPTIEETRFMAWDAIVHGARALLYWGTAYIEKDSELWEELLSVISELDALQPVLSAPDMALAVEVEHHNVFHSMDRDIAVLIKDTEEGAWLILVNTFPGPVQFSLHGLESLNGMQFEDHYSDIQAQVEDGRLHGFMRGQSVQVFKPQR